MEEQGSQALVHKVTRERAPKVYVVTEKQSGEKVFIKAKTRTAVGEHLVSQNFEIEMVAPKHMAGILDALAAGAEIHEI